MRHQIISRAENPEGVLDIVVAAGLEKPGISILLDEFLAEVRGMPQRNLAVELLQKLLAGRSGTRGRKNVVQARSFAEMREQMLRPYQNRAIEAAQVIEELIAPARDMHEAALRRAGDQRQSRQWAPATRARLSNASRSSRGAAGL